MLVDWSRIGRLVLDCHLIYPTPRMIEWYKIVNGLVPKLCLMGGALGLDGNRIDLELHNVGTEFTPQRYGLATPLALV